MCDFSEIIDHLFIGNIYSVLGNYKTNEEHVLDLLNIKVIISALTEYEYEDYMLVKDKLQNIDWYKLIIDDSIDQNISDYFFKVHSIISDTIKRNNNIIIHCAAGMSRSPTLVTAYLMIENKWTVEQAINFIKSKRNFIRPNKGFIDQLKKLEDFLQNQNNSFLT